MNGRSCRSTSFSCRGQFVGLTALFVVALGAAMPASAQPPTELFFSEYVEGSGNNKALEIFNGTGSGDRPRGRRLRRPDLLQRQCDAGQHDRADRHGRRRRRLRGGQQQRDSAPVIATADQITGSVNFNGDDAVVLRKGGDGDRLDRRGGLRPRQPSGAPARPRPRTTRCAARSTSAPATPIDDRPLRSLARVGRLRPGHLRRPRQPTSRPAPARSCRRPRRCC